MGGWNIIYALINFAILATLLYVVGKKIVIKKYNEHRDGISQKLEQSRQAQEEAQSLASKLADARLEGDKQCSEIVSQAKLRAEKNALLSRENTGMELEKLKEKNRLELKELELENTRRENADAAAAVARAAQELMRGENYAAARRAFAESFPEKLEKLIHASSADCAAIKAGKRINVICTSAALLTAQEENKVRSVVTAKFDGADEDDFCFCFETDDSLIAGLKVQINDTVYDGSAESMLSRTCAKAAVTSDGADLSEKLLNADKSIENYQVGKVISLSDGICRISGLADVMAGEMLYFTDRLSGMVMDIEQNSVSAVLLGAYGDVREGDEVRRTGKVIEVPVGENLIGRVVDALGRPLDGKGPLHEAGYRPVECQAQPILARKPVSVPLQTGIKAIDALVPIGKGQRELIIGDRKTGKTSIAIDAIINQKGKNVICIYVAIGQKESTVVGIVDKLRAYGAMDYSIIVSANASDSSPMLYISPYAGTAMGEYLMNKGRDVLIIYDDLSKHAVAYRELSLLLHRPPGREAYPGDVFYLHSRLLERAAALSDELGGGTMTALPIVETQAGDISAYIPTNVISITDGQIFLDETMFNSGLRPAVNAGLSVSRVGGAAQPGAMKQVASNLRITLAQHRELESFSQFGSDLDDATKRALNRGRKLTELLKQKKYNPLDTAQQVTAIYAANEGFFDDLDDADVAKFENGLVSTVRNRRSDLCEAMNSGRKLSTDEFNELKASIAQYKADFS